MIAAGQNAGERCPYPQANEHDAERAVRARLKLLVKIAELRPHPSVRLQLRVGIATGLAVVGDLVGSGEAQERGIVGETPNLPTTRSWPPMPIS